MTNTKASYLSCIFVMWISFMGCSTKHKSVKSTSQPIEHTIWNDLLQVYVSEQGNVNYKGFIQDSVKLNQYLSLIERNHPTDSNWTKNEQLAYWINAYNAFTVKIIIKNYPVKSIKDIAGSIPFVNSTWDIRFINIEGNDYDLNDIEHNILRKDFNEPRIHFAINCASFSCPKLLNEAYVANKIEEQLSAVATDFINDPTRNKISSENADLSKLFKWFNGDFTKNKTLIEFLNQYSKIKINTDANINYLDYDWTLNE